MRKLLGPAMAIVCLSGPWASAQTFRTMGIESHDGTFWEVFFDRVSESNGLLTIWAKKGNAVATKMVLDVKKQRLIKEKGHFEDIPPGSILEAASMLGPQLRTLNAIKPPAFRNEGKSEGGSSYYDHFTWNTKETTGRYVEFKDADRAVLWMLRRDEENAQKHSLVRVECRVKAAKYRISHRHIKIYAEQSGRDLIITASDMKGSPWTEINKGTNLWEAVYGAE